VQIDDRQAPVPQPAAFVCCTPFAPAIGPAMFDGLQHPGGDLRGQGRPVTGR